MINIQEIYKPLYKDELDQPRYIHIFGGYGSGKNYNTAIAMVNKTYSKYSHKIMYLSKRDSLKSYIDVINDMNLTKDFVINHNSIVNVKTNSCILFMGLKDKNRIFACLPLVSTLIVEELDSLTEFETFDFKVRVRNKPLSVILIYESVSIDHWIFKEWHTKKREDTVLINPMPLF